MALVVMFVIIVAAAIWYFAVYDTARGRCERGDLGACVTAITQQGIVPPSGNGAVQDDPDALRVSALAQQYNDVCRLTLPPYDVLVWVGGQGARALCHQYTIQGLAGYTGWRDDLWGSHGGLTKVCAIQRTSALALLVGDTGLGVLGQAVCSELGS